MSKQYDDYLKQHISNVQNGLAWIEQNLPEVLNGLDKTKIKN